MLMLVMQADGSSSFMTLHAWAGQDYAGTSTRRNMRADGYEVQLVGR
jgi:hypothetical protein